MPIEVTRPSSGVAEPSRVIVAGWPTLTWPMSETLTVVVASSPPAPSMTKSALELLPVLPVTCWPEVTLTSATVPLMGAARVAAARFCLASLSSALAESRLAWSDARSAAVAGPELFEPPEPPNEPLPPLPLPVRPLPVPPVPVPPVPPVPPLPPVPVPPVPE